MRAQLPARQPAMSDASADPGGVARQIVRVIGLPQGQRPFRVHVDPRHGDAEKAFNQAQSLDDRPVPEGTFLLPGFDLLPEQPGQVGCQGARLRH